MTEPHLRQEFSNAIREGGAPLKEFAKALQEATLAKIDLVKEMLSEIVYAHNQQDWENEGGALGKEDE